MRKYALGTVYAFVHFSVETACFYFLFSRLSGGSMWWALAMLFDALAFLPQSLFGVLQDRFPKWNAGLWGAILMLLALVLPWNMAALILIGLGNAMIHISGAVHTLHNVDGKIAPNAIFVGGGSFGVITGQLLGGLGISYLIAVPLVLMLISCVWLWQIPNVHSLPGAPCNFGISSKRSTSVIVLFAFIAVAIRSYIGYAIPTEWNKTVPQAIMLFVCMGLGKMLGGIVADRIGYRKTAWLSLLGGLPFLMFGNSYMMISLIGVALFSMTMPITIAILASRFSKMPGFAFGITTVALFVGVLPAFFVRPDSLLAHQVAVLLLCTLALIAILLCVEKGK